MSKYEIMLIIDPKSEEKIIFDLAKSTFKNEAKIEKLERTELAYEINKSKTAFYYLVSVEATGEEINEFMRKSNITKNIWRSLSVNLDHEKGLNRKAKPKKNRKNFHKKSISSENASSSLEEKKSVSSNEETQISKKINDKKDTNNNSKIVKKESKQTKKTKNKEEK